VQRMFNDISAEVGHRYTSSSLTVALTNASGEPPGPGFKLEGIAFCSPRL
jgi:hypothetical protein